MDASDSQIDGLRLLLSGKLMEGADTVDVENPSTNTLLAKAPQASHAQLDKPQRLEMPCRGAAETACRHHSAYRRLY